MFDVLWTDPNRELLKERIVKKEQEGKTKGNAQKRSSSDRRSTSTNSSSSSDRGFGLFVTKIRKTPGSLSKSKRPATVPESSTDGDIGDRRASTYDVKSFLSHPNPSQLTVKPATEPFLPLNLPEFGDATSTASSRDSMFSRNTQPSAASTGGWSSGPCERDSASASNPEYLFQSLGSSSFITRTTETTASPRTVDADIDRLLSEIHISSDGAKATTPSISEPPEEDLDSHESEPEQVADADVSVKAPATIGDSQFLMPPSQMPQTPPPIRVRNNLTINESNCNDEGRRPNPEAWKPPHEWDCTPTRRARSASPKDKIQHSPDSSNADHYMSPDIVALQREVKMMAMASPELILANIKAGMGDTSDTRVYKELEMTKKRWMFSALHQIGSYADLGLTDRGSDEGVPSRAHRILALYESQASASFLAALHPQVLLSHLATTPISPDLFPNVQPILVPTVSSSAAFRTLPPHLFNTVTCLSMPVLFPSTDIPPFLRHINRCLAPGGALHLTLIDPQPVSSSMGPILRQWLFENLLINLERMFRTTHPSGTFPDWLEVGRLRGKGSTIATLEVPAVPQNSGTSDGNEETSITPAKLELRTLVTRMLWQEVWGRFVRADRWWWDDESIIQECIEYGTYWQYSHIIAVKED